MKLSEILLLKKDFEQRHENYRQVATQAEQIAQVNRALRMIGWKLKPFHPRIPLTLQAGVGEYDFQSPNVVARRMHRVTNAVINGRLLEDEKGKNRVGSVMELDAEYPGWRTGPTTSYVRRAVTSGSRLLHLYPKPAQTVVEAGENFLAGYYLPGAIMSDGTYAFHGFPTEASGDGAGGTVTVYATATTATTGVVAIANAAAAGGGYSTLASNAGIWELGGFDFSAVPDDATLEMVWVENFLAGYFSGPATAMVYFYGWPTYIVPGTNLNVTDGHPTLTEHGPMAHASNLSIAELKDPGFALAVHQLSNSIALDQLRVAVRYTAAGASLPTDVDLDAVPDLVEELHDALAYLAAELSIEPTMSDEEAMMRVARYRAAWSDAIQDAIKENRRELSPADAGGRGYRWRRHYHGR